MKCANAPKGCPQTARQAVHGGVVTLLLCMPCWRRYLEVLADAVGIRVRPIGGLA